MQEHELVLKQDEDAFVGNFEGLRTLRLEELSVAQVNHIQHRHVDHQLDLQPGLLE